MIPTQDRTGDSTPPPAQQPTAAVPAAHLPTRLADRASGTRVEAALQDALRAALSRLDGQLTRVDGKASALLTLATALAGGALTVVSILAVGHTVPAAAAVLAWAAAAALIAAVGTLLRVVRPAVASGAGFPAWAERSLEQLLADLVAGDTSNPATEVLFLSRLAVTKYRLVRRAVDLMITGLALAVLTAVTAAALR